MPDYKKEILDYYKKYDIYLKNVNDSYRFNVIQAYEAVKKGFEGEENKFRQIKIQHPNITIFTNDGVDFYVI